MPRKRSGLDRDEKVAEILALATGILRDGRVQELTVNRVASDLGLARAAVYWYFPSRDDLFVAATSQLFAEAFSVPPARATVRRQIEWAVDTLAGLYPVYAELQQIAAEHAGAADVLVGFQVGLCDALKGILRPQIEERAVQGVADTFVMFCEGLLGRRLPAPLRRRHLNFAMDAILGIPRRRR